MTSICQEGDNYNKIIAYLDERKYFISDEMKNIYILEQCDTIFDILINKNYINFDKDDYILLYFAGLAYTESDDSDTATILRKYYCAAIKQAVSYDAIINMNQYNDYTTKQYKDEISEPKEDIKIHERNILNYKENIHRIDAEFNGALRAASIDNLMHVGLYYQQNKNYDKMITFYGAACDKNHIGAMVILGTYYKELVETEQNNNLICDNNSDSEDDDIIFYYGCTYYKKQMIKYYRQAAKNGDIYSKLELNKYAHEKASKANDKDKDNEYNLNVQKGIIAIAKMYSVLFAIYFGQKAMGDPFGNIINMFN